MRTMLVRTAIGLVAAGLAMSVAFAQTSGAAMGEITVTASRTPKITKSGWPKEPVSQISLSYVVSATGFDLTTAAGQAAIEKAVNDTAADVCKEIDRQYPSNVTTDADCVKTAISKAMVQVKEAIIVAKAEKKKAGK